MTADANPLLGTWKLKSYVATTAAGATTMPYGERPTGYLSYSKDGRMSAIGTTAGHTRPSSPAATDDEQVTLYQTMFAYAGTFTVDDRKVTHHVDISWNQVWAGTDQVRFYRVAGDTLVLTSRAIDPSDQQETHYAVTWQRATGAS